MDTIIPLVKSVYDVDLISETLYIEYLAESLAQNRTRLNINRL